MSDRLERKIEVINRRGLHARASAKLAALANDLQTSVTVAKGGEAVKANSIMGLMMLGAARGDHVTVSAEGAGADLALEKVIALFNDRFGEGE